MVIAVILVRESVEYYMKYQYYKLCNLLDGSGSRVALCIYTLYFVCLFNWSVC